LTFIDLRVRRSQPVHLASFQNVATNAKSDIFRTKNARDHRDRGDRAPAPANGDKASGVALGIESTRAKEPALSS